MLSAITGLTEVGIFTTMVFLSNALFVPYVSLIRISAPLVPRYWKKRDMESLLMIYRKVSSTGYFVTFFLFAVVWFNIDLALSYLPDVYAEGKYIFLLLMLGRMFDALGGLNGDILLTSKKFRVEFWLTLPLVFLVFLLNSILIPIYGGVGAAIVTCLIYAIYNILRLLINLYYFKLWPFDKVFLKVFLLSLVMFASGSLLLDLSQDPLFRLIVGLLIPIILFAIPVYKLRWVPDISLFLDQAVSKFKKG
jgi:O-antigen/teichoic acid export membrane protein